MLPGSVVVSTCLIEELFNSFLDFYILVPASLVDTFVQAT
jgi:hypothetical protein